MAVIRWQDDRLGCERMHHECTGDFRIRQSHGESQCTLELVAPNTDSSSRLLKRAQVQNCRMYNNSQHGVLCHDNGKGFFEFNEIYGNQLAGVEIRDGGNPTFRQNVIHGHPGRAKFLNPARLGTHCIVSVVSDSELYMRQPCTDVTASLPSSASSGIYIYNNGRALLER